MDDLISRQAAIDAVVDEFKRSPTPAIRAKLRLEALPSAQPELGKNTMPEQPKMDRLGVKTGETCTDVISRQAAIEAMGKAKWAKERLEELPSAQPEPKWIPCSERLPENEYVLISKKPTMISGDKWSVAIAVRMADQRSGKIQWRDTGFGVIQDDKVLAWMPLPEAYQGGEE